MGPYLEIKVDGTRQLLYRSREILLIDVLVQNGHCHEEVLHT